MLEVAVGKDICRQNEELLAHEEECERQQTSRGIIIYVRVLLLIGLYDAYELALIVH